MIPTITHFIAPTPGLVVLAAVSPTKMMPITMNAVPSQRCQVTCSPKNTLPRYGAQHIADGSHGQHVAQIRPAQQRHARQQPQNQQRRSQQHPRGEDQADVGQRRKTQIDGLVLHAPGHRKVAEHVGDNHKSSQQLGLEIDSPCAGRWRVERSFHHGPAIYDAPPSAPRSAAEASFCSLTNFLRPLLTNRYSRASL